VKPWPGRGRRWNPLRRQPCLADLRALRLPGLGPIERAAPYFAGFVARFTLMSMVAPLTATTPYFFW